jgi:hypothetical protein
VSFRAPNINLLLGELASKILTICRHIITGVHVKSGIIVDDGFYHAYLWPLTSSIVINVFCIRYLLHNHANYSYLAEINSYRTFIDCICIYLNLAASLIISHVSTRTTYIQHIWNKNRYSTGVTPLLVGKGFPWGYLNDKTTFFCSLANR